MTGHHSGATDFEDRYREDPDPFGGRPRWDARREIQFVVASLTRERYAHAWDLACGTGDLALALTARCARVTATDAAPTAVDLTRDLLRDKDADVSVSALPARAVPAGSCDLVVASEVLYYLDEASRQATYDAMLVAAESESGCDTADHAAEVVAVHWRHHPHDAHLSGADVTAELDARLTAAGWERAVRHEDTDFVAGHWICRPIPTEETT